MPRRRCGACTRSSGAERRSPGRRSRCTSWSTTERTCRRSPPRCSGASPTTSSRWPTPRRPRCTSSSTTSRGREASVPPRIAGLTKLTLETAPSVCHECIWWQTRGRRDVDKGRWMERAELEDGAFGTIYYDGDGRVLGSMQYGASGLFPRAGELPAGPPADDAMLVTCAYLVDETSPWVLQSLFLAAIGEARERGAKAVEAFAYRYPEGESTYERFHVHKTIFPADFLGDFGFRIVR